MSRSYKKPSYSDYSRGHTKWAKRQASKAVRRYQGEISSGCQYKKIYPSWDIFDYKGLWFSWNFGAMKPDPIPPQAYRK